MNKHERRLRRKKGIRKKIHGTFGVPRVTVYKSNKHLYLQAVDDDTGKTLLFSSDLESGVKNNREGARSVGMQAAEKMKKKKITQVVFDRNGNIYHGVVKSVADGMREGGIKL